MHWSFISLDSYDCPRFAMSFASNTDLSRQLLLISYLNFHFPTLQLFVFNVGQYLIQQ